MRDKGVTPRVEPVALHCQGRDFHNAVQQNLITTMDNECCVFPILPFYKMRAVSVFILSLLTICFQVYRLPDYENSSPNLIVRTIHHPEMLGFELDEVTARQFGLFSWQK